jgi:trigger factor
VNVESATNLDVSVERPGGLERRMTVRVPAVDIEREVNSRLIRVSKTAKLKGFRPGKIPQKVVRQRYEGQVRQEVLSDVIRASFTRAIEQEKLNPAGGPRIEPLPGADTEHFSYQATFEVYPEIKLKALAALSIEKPQVQITEADTDEMIGKLKDQRAEWQTAERRAAVGDRVIVDFIGRIGKEPFEGGEGTEVPIELGAGQVLEDFEKALKGVTAEQSRSAKVKFPKDYPAAELAGKKAVFDITVHRVEEKVLPDVDDEFLEAFGVKEGGLEALRAEVRSNMERELEERLKAETKRRVLDALLDVNGIDVPRALVEQEISNLQAEAMRRLGTEDPEQAPSREHFQDSAERRVALGLLVQEVVQEHGIEVDRERVDRRINELVAPYEKPEEVAQIYRSNRELLAQLESGVLEDQVVDYVLEHAKTKDKSVAFKEFMM